MQTSRLLHFFSTLLCSAMALASALFLPGCMMERGYHGAAKSAELAIVRGHGVFLRSSNGIELSKASSGVLIAPGRNEIEFVVDPSTFNARRPDEQLYSITFSAQGGQEYVITGRRGDGRLCAWPVIEKSGEPNFSAPAGCATAKSRTAPREPS